MTDHAAGLEQPAILSKASAPIAPLTEQRAVSRRSGRLRFYAALGVVLLTFAVSGLGKDREFWQLAWQQRTLFPQCPPCGCDMRANELVRPIAFQPPPSFDLSQLVIPQSELRPGGPAKDGIPALTNPKFLAASETTYLRPEDRIIGLVTATRESRAYPLKILNYHEIVNDQLGDLAVAVTYCPLCDSCAVFDRRTELGEREFGVSGLLYNSNVLMYDRGGIPESLWSQVLTRGISGPAAEKSLRALPLELTTWQDWLSRYPETKVLSPDTGHRRNYGRSPYGGYFSAPRLMFPVNPRSDRLATKARVLGVWTDKVVRAYPESAFGPNRLRIADTLDGKNVTIEFNPQARSLRVTQADDGVSWMYSLWFAWYALRPDTDVFDQ